MNTPQKLPFELYIDNAGEHRWRITAGNGEPLGAASEGFASKAGARANAQLVCAALTAHHREPGPVPYQEILDWFGEALPVFEVDHPKAYAKAAAGLVQAFTVVVANIGIPEHLQAHVETLKAEFTKVAQLTEKAE